jgi:hypothetical protein
MSAAVGGLKDFPFVDHENKVKPFSFYRWLYKTQEQKHGIIFCCKGCEYFPCVKK